MDTSSPVPFLRVACRGVLVAILLALLAGLASTTPAHAITREDVCDLAETFNEQARPQDALALISDYRTSTSSRSACSEQHAEAQGRVALAVTLTGTDDAAFTADATLRAQVERFCRWPVPSSGGSAATDPASERLAAVVACDATAGPEKPESNTWSERVGKAFDDVIASWVVPLTDVALAMFGYAAAIYVVGRLLTRLLSVPALATFAARNSLRRGATWGAVGMTAVAALTFGWIIVAPALGTSARAGLLVVLVLTTATAIAVTTLLLGSRFRIAVTAVGPDGAEDPGTAAQVVGLLNEMGANAPGGAEYPRGTDVVALDDAVVRALPAGAVAKAVLAVVTVFLPRSPWEVRIDRRDADAETVQIHRNGRSIAAVVVDRDELGLRIPVVDPAERNAEAPTGGAAKGGAAKDGDGPPRLPDLHRVSAAVVLSVLREPHRISGLGGATRWQSIALQSVATTELRHQKSDAIPLLAHAVTADEDNLAASLALLHFRYRTSTKTTELTLFADGLERLIERMPADLTPTNDEAMWLLRQRARLARVVALANRAFTTDGEPDQLLLAQARAGAGEIFAEPRISGERRQLAEAIRRDAAILRCVATTRVPPRPLTPLEYHQSACHYSTAPAIDVPRAIGYLLMADVDPVASAWRADDPQLADLRRTDKYRAAFGAKPGVGSLFALPAFAALEPALRRLGIGDEHALLAHDPAELAPLLGITTTSTQRLVALAELAARVPGGLQAWRFDVAAWVADGNARKSSLTEVAEAVAARYGESLTTAQQAALIAWLGVEHGRPARPV